MGSAAANLIDYLQAAEDESDPCLYAKAISIVQSSGMGKSRMLTEARSFYSSDLRDLTEFVLGWSTRVHPSHLPS
jgi:hypothetical protein